MSFLKSAENSAHAFGIRYKGSVEPDRFLEDGDIINFGRQQLTVFYTPGHADGSVCFYHKESGIVIVGDVLFNGSIGRTDLPTGDFSLLEKSIREKLYTLPNETIVYSGHGKPTTIGHEKKTNPFFKQ
jgi:glyoxylase-like metal-dependent hydrolase (beta-lactamase superfamily II)